MILKIEWANSDSRIEIQRNPDYHGDWIVTVVYEVDTSLTHQASVVMSRQDLIKFLSAALAVLQQAGA